MGKKVIIIGTDISLCMHVDNKGRDILILGEGPTQGLDDTTLTVEAKYPIKVYSIRKNIMLSLDYNGSNSFLFIEAAELYQFKEKKPRNERLCTVFR